MANLKTHHKRDILSEDEVERLEETVLRLHVYLKRVYEEYDGFRDIFRRIRKRLSINFRGEGVVELDQFREYSYYQGKMMAYLYVLRWQGSYVPRLIERLRGIRYDSRGARAVETKYVLPMDDVGPPVEPNHSKGRGK